MLLYGIRELAIPRIEVDQSVLNVNADESLMSVLPYSVGLLCDISCYVLMFQVNPLVRGDLEHFIGFADLHPTQQQP